MKLNEETEWDWREMQPAGVGLIKLTQEQLEQLQRKWGPCAICPPVMFRLRPPSLLPCLTGADIISNCVLGWDGGGFY